MVAESGRGGCADRADGRRHRGPHVLALADDECGRLLESDGPRVSTVSVVATAALEDCTVAVTTAPERRPETGPR